ncbi:MAG: inositol monophosphatase family protein [Verrucomicrobiota bacterium]
MTDWLATCRAAVEDVRTVLAELPARSDREPVVGAGVGGDDTTAIDAAVERAVVARLDATGDRFTLVSEELGVRAPEYESDSRTSIESDSDSRPDPGIWVVLDPIDGSINAKRGLPFFSLSVAVGEGGTMDDVTFGYVYDFGTGDEWTAERGGGAKLNGELLSGEAPKDRIEILALEATRTDLVAHHAPPLVGLVHRLRVFGSLALSLCHLADGRVDAVCSLKPARSVDIAAAQLLVRERGYAIELPDDPPFGAAPLDLEGRSRVVAAGTIDLCAKVAAALSA